MPKARYLNRSERKRPYYLRMSVLNKVGVLKSIAQIFAQKSISIKSIIQLNTSNEKTVPIIIISDPVGVDKINANVIFSGTDSLASTTFDMDNKNNALRGYTNLVEIENLIGQAKTP